MASCEKCWADASGAMTGSTPTEYSRLVNERKDNPCSPEEQAGEHAKECPKCKRKTMHQYVHICTNGCV